MNNELTELVFILDRSGSMYGLESDTIGGFNGVLTKHKKQAGQAMVSTLLFNHETTVLHDRVDIKEVKPLKEKDYDPQGCTALLDAVGGAIRHISQVQGYMPPEYKAGKVIFVIATDGLENASHKYSAHEVRQLIEKHQEEGWEFIFMGANLDAVAEAGKLGIPEDRSVTYLADEQGTEALFEAVGDFTCAARKAPSTRQGKTWKRCVEEDVRKRG